MVGSKKSYNSYSNYYNSNDVSVHVVIDALRYPPMHDMYRCVIHKSHERCSICANSVCPGCRCLPSEVIILVAIVVIFMMILDLPRHV